MSFENITDHRYLKLYDRKLILIVEISDVCFHITKIITYIIKQIMNVET